MNALTIAPQNASLSLLMDPAKFEHLQRVGKMLALSPLFPEHLRKGGIEAAISNGALVLNMANRLNEDPLTVAQNIYFVGGKPGWNTSYMIGKTNQAGVFRDPIDWEIKGEKENLCVTAFAVLAKTGKKVEVTLDWQVAVKEGWTKNQKYQSIPVQMFRYRTAAFLIRLYCPEVMIGLPMQIEQELESAEMRDVSPDDAPVVVANKEAPIEATAQPVRPAAKPAAEPAKPAKAETVAPKPQEADPVQEEQTEGPDLFGGQDDRQADEGQFRALLDMMIADLEASGPDEVESVYSVQVDQMRMSAPGCYRDWQDALTAARSA
jgi:hypothetical protein